MQHNNKPRVLAFAAALLAAAGALIILVPPIRFLGLVLLALAALCGVYALLEHRRARKTLILLRALTAVGAAVFLVTEAFVISGAKTSGAENADYLIVLGAQVNGETPSLMLASRLAEARAYLETHPDTMAVLSGGRGPGEDVTEASAMRAYLVSRGVDPARLIDEPNAHDTIQNLRYSFAIIDSLGGGDTKICVVSNDFHLFRAKTIASLEGREVATLNAPTPRPDLAVCYYIREFFSLIKVALSYI